MYDASVLVFGWAALNAIGCLLCLLFDYLDNTPRTYHWLSAEEIADDDRRERDREIREDFRDY